MNLPGTIAVMIARLKPWLPYLKALLALAIIAGVCWLFVRILQSEELQQTDRSRTPLQILGDQLAAALWADLGLSGALYLTGLAFPCAFWFLLLRWVGSPLSVPQTLRIYYISHLGKYAPLGKGWALLLRTTLSHSAGIRAGVAALTGTYETLTTMASGSLLAAILIMVQLGSEKNLIWAALGLLALAGIPILPGVFNALVQRLSARFLLNDQRLLPQLGSGTLLVGLGLTAMNWVLLGLSIVALIHAIQPGPAAWEAVSMLRCIAFVAVSYVAGFVASTPGGLGVREVILQQLLAPHVGAGPAVVVVVLHRLIWTVAELVMAGALWFVPPGSARTALLPTPLTRTATESAVPLSPSLPDTP